MTLRRAEGAAMFIWAVKRLQVSQTDRRLARKVPGSWPVVAERLEETWKAWCLARLMHAASYDT